MLACVTRWRFILCSCGAALFLLATAEGAMDWTWDTGVRWGTDDSEVRAHVDEYDAYVTWQTPWRRSEPHAFAIGLVLNASAGVQHGEGDTGLIMQWGPGLVLGRVQGRLSLDLGSAATYLSKSSYGDLDLGSNLQFTSHLGLRFDLWGPWGISYRFQHTSNAGLDHPNPGLDMHVVGAGLRF